MLFCLPLCVVSHCGSFAHTFSCLFLLVVARAGATACSYYTPLQHPALFYLPNSLPSPTTYPTPYPLPAMRSFAHFAAPPAASSTWAGWFFLFLPRTLFYGTLVLFSLPLPPYHFCMAHLPALLFYLCFVYLYPHCYYSSCIFLVDCLFSFYTLPSTLIPILTYLVCMHLKTTARRFSTPGTAYSCGSFPTAILFFFLSPRASLSPPAMPPACALLLCLLRACVALLTFTHTAHRCRYLYSSAVTGTFLTILVALLYLWAFAHLLVGSLGLVYGFSNIAIMPARACAYARHYTTDSPGVAAFGRRGGVAAWRGVAWFGMKMPLLPLCGLSSTHTFAVAARRRFGVFTGSGSLLLLVLLPL